MAMANHLLAQRPLRGGVIVRNPFCAAPGTLGFIATSDDNDRWIVSCYHVLVREDFGDEFDDGEPIHQPEGQRVATLSANRVDKRLDCAAALIDPAIDGLAKILGLETIAQPIAAEEGMMLLKSGISTGVTEGRVRKVQSDGTIEIERTHRDAELSEKGDSGALWVERETGAAVGLLTGVDTHGFACASPIEDVLATLGLKLLLSH